jgi:hypothetical protein
MGEEPETPPAGSEQSDEEYLAALGDGRVLAIFERKNAEAAGRRREVREAMTATERARSELAAEVERREQLERARESDAERAVREAREEERQRLTAEHDQAREGERREHRHAIATLAIKAHAAGKFADPDDAVRLLPLEELLAIEDERDRERAVDEALDKLLEAKPYLARASGPRPPLVTPGARSGERPNGRPRERSWLRG